VIAASRRRWTLADSATAHLVRIVLADDWSPDIAGRRLHELVGDDRRLLRDVRARVRRAATERPSEVAQRALATLNAALGEAEPA